MKRIFKIFCVLMCLSAPVSADDTAYIEVETLYAYATSPVQKNGAVFGSIKNLGVEHLSGKDLVIRKVESDAAEKVELHTHIMDGDVMMMREVSEYALPDGESLTLQPMGNHIMLFGLKEPLKIGETFPITIFIGDGYSHAYGGVEAMVEIVAPGTKPGEPAE